MLKTKILLDRILPSVISSIVLDYGGGIKKLHDYIVAKYGNYVYVPYYVDNSHSVNNIPSSDYLSRNCVCNQKFDFGDSIDELIELHSRLEKEYHLSSKTKMAIFVISRPFQYCDVKEYFKCCNEKSSLDEKIKEADSDSSINTENEMINEFLSSELTEEDLDAEIDEIFETESLTPIYTFSEYFVDHKQSHDHIHVEVPQQLDYYITLKVNYVNWYNSLIKIYINGSLSIYIRFVVHHIPCFSYIIVDNYKLELIPLVDGYEKKLYDAVFGIIMAKCDSSYIQNIDLISSTAVDLVVTVREKLC